MAEGGAGPAASHSTDRTALAWTVVLLLMALAAVGVLVRLAFLAPTDADEVEHAHAAWLIATGHRPYRDFHQIHMPLVWLLAAPVAALVSTPSLLIVTLRLRPASQRRRGFLPRTCWYFGSDSAHWCRSSSRIIPAATTRPYWSWQDSRWASPLLR